MTHQHFSVNIKLVIKMDILTSNTNAKIIEIKKMSWDKSNVYVSPRPYHALAFRLKGKAIFEVGNLRVETNTNNVILMPANTGYYAKYPERNEIIVIHFHTDDKLDLKNYSTNQTEIIYNLFKNALDIWLNKNKAYYYDSISKFYQILSSLDVLTQKNDATNEEFFKAIEYLNDNFTNPDISVETLSKIAKMSSTYFRRLTFENFNCTPTNYILKLRLEYAEKLLSTGKYTINDVSYMSALMTQNILAELLKKHMEYHRQNFIFTTNKKSTDILSVLKF